MIILMAMISAKNTIGIGILLILMVLLGYLILDIKGTEIDLNNRMVREYTLYPWVRIGKWHNVEKYSMVQLHYESYRMRSMAYNSRRGAPQYQKNHHFVVKLMGIGAVNQIVVIENEYRDAKKTLYQVANALRIPADDRFAQRVRKAKRRTAEEVRKYGKR